ncbi:hypothetical protein TNCV_1733861 [Trichonephila clavipes]|nr:hypothetical protein TNCV_1733861 [Trichonephila clavipes]
MENVRRVDIRLCSTEEQARKLIAKSNFNRRTIFSENLMAVHLQKTQIKFLKPIQEKTIQLAPSFRKPKPLQEKNNSTQQKERNDSTRQEKTTQFGSRNETTRLCAACNRLYSRIGFSYLLTPITH